MIRSGLLLLAICGAASAAVQPIIDNERVTVWDVTWSAADPAPVPAHQHDFVTVYLAGPHKGKAEFAHKGVSKGEPGERTLVIELKDHPVAPLENKTGFQLAFPRPHAKKLQENDRIITWSYTWVPGEASPMHFHDKDVVVTYLEPTALSSTTPDGKKTVNEYSAFQTKFNLRDRVHSELLIRGSGSAIMTELK